MAPVKTKELLTFSYAMTLCCAIIESFQLLVHNQPFALLRSSHPEVFCKKDVLRNSAKFKGRHLHQNFFFNCKFRVL